jgi:hypothetical protein
LNCWSFAKHKDNAVRKEKQKNDEE